MDIEEYKIWNYHEYWSFDENKLPRDPQVKIINDIAEAMDMGFKNIIVEAGTGIGKSAIAITIANMVEDCYILTRTKQLQNQYLNDFDDTLVEIKGKGNYTCSKYGGTCDGCIKKIEKIKQCTNCQYKIAKQTAIISDITLTNYHYLYNASKFTDDWNVRDLLILDEAHKFEEFTMGVISKSLSQDYYLKKYGIDLFDNIKKGDTLTSWEKPEKWAPIIDRLIDAFILEKNGLKQEFEITSDINQRKRIAKQIDSLESKIQSFYDFKNVMIKDNWVVVLPRKYQIMNNDKKLQVEFKPTNVKQYTNELLKLGSTRLFLTGTIGDFDKYCEWININPDETFLIREKSNFPISNRPIFKDYVCNMTGSTNKVPNWKKQSVLNKIRNILMKHKGEKGIIHTTSHYQTNWICDNLPEFELWKISSDKNYNPFGLSREDLITRFKHVDYPVILVGAGIKDGVDFPDDQCRFQILVKVPIPKFDAQVFERNREDKVWVKYQAVMDTVQAYGRGVRSETDYCKFYVLDSYLDYLLFNWKYLFNEYFLEAIRQPKKKIIKPIPVGGK